MKIIIPKRAYMIPLKSIYKKELEKIGINRCYMIPHCGNIKK